MVRPLRVQFPGAVYHIISKGIEGKDILCNDTEKQYFLKLLLDAKRFYKIKIYLYCFLSNHYHVSIETLLGNVSQVIHWINSTYTSWYNRLYERKGHLFQGRFKSILVDRDEYLLELSKYVHLNPVKAGIVKYPEDYKWSSYRAYIGLESSTFLDTNFILDLFGHHLDSARMSYKKFVEAGIGVDEDLMKKLSKGFILGGEKFVKTIIEKASAFKEEREIPQLKELRKTMEIDDFLSRIEKEGISINNKGTWGNVDRDIIIYLCKRFTLSSNREIGIRFGLTDATVSYICKKIERCKDEESIRNKIGKTAKIFDF